MMKKNMLLLLLILITPHLYLAQSDNDYDQQLLFTFLYNKEYAKSKNIIDSKFLNTRDNSKKVIGYVYLARYYNYLDNEIKKVESLKNAKTIAQKTKKEIDLAYVNYGYACYYFDIGKTELFVKLINESINTFSKYPNENFILTLLYDAKKNYKDYKTLNKECGDYFNANMYALKTHNNTLIFITYNNLGYFYKKMFKSTNERKYLDLARNNCIKAYKYAILIENPISQKKSLIFYYLNYGSITQESSNIEESLKLYNQSLSLSLSENYNETTVLTYVNIGQVYEQQGKNNLAEDYYLKAYDISKNNKDVSTANKIIIVNNLSKIYEKLKVPDKALMYGRKSIKLTEQNFEQQIRRNVKSLEIYYQTEQKYRLIKKLNDERKYHNKYRLHIGILILSIISLIFLVYVYRCKQKLNKQKAAQLEVVNHHTNLRLKLEKEEKHRLAQQQEQLQKQALATSLQLNQKALLIDKLKEKIKERRDLYLEKIIKEEQFTDNDFNTIQNIIQEVHTNFFKKLNEISKSKLTPHDLRYAAYIYLNMDNQQISNILKADPKTVRMAKYRLKQKLGLVKEEDLQVFIQSLELY